METNDKNTANMPREEKIKLLLDYAKECYKHGRKPTKRGTRKRFHLEIYNYFKNNADYHKQAGIPVAFRYYPKEIARSIIVEYVRKEYNVNRYPEFREIEKKFKISFDTYFSDLKELYQLAGIDLSLVEKARNLSRFYKKNVIDEQKCKIKEFIR